MEDLQELWNRCLEIIRQKVDDWVFVTWFMPVTCERYDLQHNTVLLQVPSTYVYEFIEHYYAGLMSQALSAVFKPGVRLQYRVRQNADGHPVDFLQTPKYRIPHVAVPNARERLANGLRHYLGETAVWLPAYDDVAGWLSDNKGRGLLCIGTSGLGKTLVCTRILPVIFGSSVKCVSAQDMSARIDELMKERCVVIDDLGKEPARLYGQPDRSFFKLCDAAEKQGILLIVTTNLTTTPVRENLRHIYPESILERYGPEVIDRLRATTKVVSFTGESLRRSDV